MSNDPVIREHLISPKPFNSKISDPLWKALHIPGKQGIDLYFFIQTMSDDIEDLTENPVKKGDYYSDFPIILHNILMEFNILFYEGRSLDKLIQLIDESSFSLTIKNHSKFDIYEAVLWRELFDLYQYLMPKYKFSFTFDILITEGTLALFWRVDVESNKLSNNGLNKLFSNQNGLLRNYQIPPSFQSYPTTSKFLEACFKGCDDPFIRKQYFQTLSVRSKFIKFIRSNAYAAMAGPKGETLKTNRGYLKNINHKKKK